MCESQRPVPQGAELQHEIQDTEAVRGRQREQLQSGDRPGGKGRVQERHGGSQAEISLQLPLQERHEEGEKLPTYLLEHVPKLTGYVTKH